MKRRWVIAMVVGCISVAIAVAVSWPRGGGPRYRGRSLSAWIVIASDSDAGLSGEAAQAVREIGTNALPSLLEWIRYEPGFGPNKVSRVIEKLPGVIRHSRILQSALEDRAFHQSTIAQLGFRVLGPRASPAIPELSRLMNDPAKPYASSEATYALFGIGEEALPALVAVLTNRQAPSRHVAALLLGNRRVWGTKTRPAVPVLVSCLNDQDPGVADAAATALGRLKLEPEIVVPALIDSLQNPAQRIRRRAAMALGEFGSAATSAVAALVQMLPGGDKEFCAEVTNTLRRIEADIGEGGKKPNEGREN